jgi:NAD(P)-dependent dehydrogenase (short-subunit alcohol dehydrogenase family)
LISSISAKIGSTSTSAAYSAAKAGVIGMTIGLAKQLEQHNVLINAIAPGSIGTGEPMNDEEIAFEDANYPLPIVGPDPVARACLYLAGLGGSWSSGTVLNVSGGRLHGW